MERMPLLPLTTNKFIHDNGKVNIFEHYPNHICTFLLCHRDFQSNIGGPFFEDQQDHAASTLHS